MSKIQRHILKEKEIFVGLEDSKRSWKLCVRSAGVIVNETSMPAKFAVLRSYFENKFPECKINVIYEAGFRGFGLHDQLVDQGWNCIVTPPHTVTQEKVQRQKNDRIDCRRLAKNLENNDYRQCFVPDKQLREDRQISRTYAQIQNDIVRVCNRIRRTLEFHGLDEQFAPGRWSRSQYRKLAIMLDHMGLSDSLCFSLQIMFSELKQLWMLRTQLLKQLRQLAKSESYKESVDILKSAPGIGPLTSIRLALEWGDLRRFNRKEDFASFLGLIPSDYSSGEQDHKGHITKQGNRGVRAWLMECSWVAIRYDAALLDKYQSVFRNSGSKKKAIVAVARKLAIRLRALLLTRQTYVIGKLV
ncbi:MAG: IS110 family transposase [Lentisphaerae bacterium]|nr:IS110 family transposase [Lentisphaerota bacterium]